MELKFKKNRDGKVRQQQQLVRNINASPSDVSAISFSKVPQQQITH